MKKIQTIAGLLLLMVGQAVAQTTDYDTNRGFIHPGGLHTQEDFDRVKAQIAAGNTKVKQAYNKLTSSEYSQSGVQTYPTEIIVRGGNGENYMNAARGAAMAYQNALRWKIAGTKANANAAVRILMAWANTTKGIGGDSNYALAAGLYGYQFAQAAELMRDYEGWSHEDFERFKTWMLTVWYPANIDFLRGRNGTWENSSKWWQAPGHYWSNWGLCNALCVISIGILCDDVYIYNQGMSFIKYDQCGTFTDPRTEVPIKNDGLTEFMGNFVVTTYESELETEAYGLLGQLNESGRDAGHSSMSLGVMLDVAKVAWNQGDDLFAYMDHRLAAGIEYLAAQSLSVEGLPWVDYIYGTNGYYYTDSRCWTMTSPAMGAQMRPYWGTVIGIYEGVKGVAMPFSEQAYANMGIDGGGAGSTSGGYDHLGFSVLMNTRDVQLCPADSVPTELTPKMEFSSTVGSNLIPGLEQEKTRGLISGKTISHNELGGLVNHFTVNTNTTVPNGQMLRLIPQLPEGEEDTGLWLWNTGEQTRDITVSTDRSYVYRVSYTNSKGVESQLCFPIAVKGDCLKATLNPTLTIGTDAAIADSTARILYGKTATLRVQPTFGWGTFKWTGGKTTQEITTSSLRKNSDFTVDYTNQGGAVSSLTFHLDVMAAQPYATAAGKSLAVQEEEATLVADKFWALTSSVCVEAGSDLRLGLTLPSLVRAANVTWDDNSIGDTLVISNIRESRTYTATFTLSGEEVQMHFYVLVKGSEATGIEPGKYRLRHVATDTYLTAQAKNQAATFEPLRSDDNSQLWLLDCNTRSKYMLISLANTDSLVLGSTGRMTASSLYSFYIDQAVGTNRIAIHTSISTTNPQFLAVSDGLIEMTSDKSLVSFPFELLATDGDTGIDSPTLGDEMNNEKLKGKNGDGAMYDLNGHQTSLTSVSSASSVLPKGVYIMNGKKFIVK